ncbi:MAG: ABC transporter ATP-binding protein [Promethearchaeota archaeon]
MSASGKKRDGKAASGEAGGSDGGNGASRGTGTGEGPVLRVENLVREFRLGKNVVRALKGVTFEVARGEFTSIMGKSGSGKTTLLNILGTLDTPTSGEVYIDGKPVSKMRDSERTAIRREKLGFVFQNYNLIPVLSAVENVELPLFNTQLGKKERRQKAMEMLELVGLGGREYHKPEEMSGGQAQRVSIARALVSDPAVILADEPTGALDTRTGEKIIQLFERLNEKGYTFILVTHDEEIGKRARRKIVLVDGEIQSDSG